MEKSFTPSAIRKRLWRLNNQDLYLKSNRERTWTTKGINIKQANELRNTKDSCDLCNVKNVRLCVDHDHVTGKIRGILCGNCNRGLGIFKDNSLVLRKAADYIDRLDDLVYN